MGIKNMSKKGEILARHYIFALILFGLVVGIGFLIVEDMASPSTGYNIPNMSDEKYEEDYDTLSETTSDVYKMQNATASEGGMSVVSTYTTMFKSTFAIISIVFNSFGMVDNAMTAFATDFGVPSELANLFFPGILVLMIATIIFVVVSAVSRGKI